MYKSRDLTFFKHPYLCSFPVLYTGIPSGTLFPNPIPKIDSRTLFGDFFRNSNPSPGLGGCLGAYNGANTGAKGV